MNPIRVILVDDHTLLRAGLRALLNAMAGVEVVAEAADGEEALACVQRLRPDILMSDIAMPRLNGLELTTRMAKEFPETRVVILSMHSSEEYARQLLRAGAVGYLLKDSGISELEIALRAVARGETYLSPVISKQVMADYLRFANGEPPTAVPLTPRQKEILQLIAAGCSTKAIARDLGISPKTVEAHRSQLMDRLDIHEIAGLVRYAIRTGLAKPEG